MKKVKGFLAAVVLLVIIAGCVAGLLWFQNWPMRFKAEMDNFFGKGNWEYLSSEIKQSIIYEKYHRVRSNPLQSGNGPGWYKNWYIAFENRYGEEEVWYITNHAYKINHDRYRYEFFTGKRFSARQALGLELMEISFDMVGEEVMNEIILDVLTEEEASCMEISMSYEGGNPKPKVYSALLKEPWFKANEITAADYLATDIYDFHLYIRVHDYRLEKLTEEQQQNVLDSFEVIQDKLKETYGEDTAYEMFWGDGCTAEYGL